MCVTHIRGEISGVGWENAKHVANFECHKKNFLPGSKAECWNGICMISLLKKVYFGLRYKIKVWKTLQTINNTNL